jgi:predicted transcriptional regulator
MEKVNSEKSIGIYGAGIVAKRLYDSHVIDNDRIIGFAVTENPDMAIIHGKPVETIDKYIHTDECFIIIAANEKNAQEMEKTLLKCSFTNYWIIDAWILLCVNKLLNMRLEKNI